MNINIFAITIFQLRTFKTQFMTKTKALVYHRLCNSVAERIKHTTFSIPTYHEKISNPVRSRFSVKFMIRSKSPRRKNNRALIYDSLQSSVTERIKHEVSDISTYLQKSSNPIRSRFFHSWPAITLKKNIPA